MDNSLKVSVSRPAYSDLCGSPYSVRESAGSPQDDAAVAMQKYFRGNRVRRQIADCAILARDYGWWNVLEGVVLSQNLEVNREHDNATNRWMRAGKKAAKLGKGLSKDETARQLAFQHWLEAIDARHRYGHNLHQYYDVWFESGTNEPFFHWLDVGEGRFEDLKRCSRAKLFKQQISYLGPTQRKEFEVTIKDGKLIHAKTGELIHTDSDCDKWIFVMSTTGRIYVGQKKKGKFQHSSFLAGGAAKAAGRLVAINGVLELIEAHSGHYRPTEEDFKGFLQELQTRGVDLSKVKIDYASREMSKLKKLKKKDSYMDSTVEEDSAAQNGHCTEEDSVRKLAEEFVSTLKTAAASPRSEAKQQQQQEELEGPESVRARKRPPGLEIKKQKSFNGWSSEGGARLFSLSIVPHDLRNKALDVVGTPRENTVRCGRFGPFTTPISPIVFAV